MDWSAVAISTGSLVLGGALTIAGQYLSDRRTARREALSRKVEFQRQNFEHERQALLELQEFIVTISRAAIQEKVRRKVSEDPDFFRSFPILATDKVTELEEASESLKRDISYRMHDFEDNNKRVEELLRALDAGGDRDAIEVELGRLGEQALAAAKELKELMTLKLGEVHTSSRDLTASLAEMTERTEKSSDFRAAFEEFIHQARLRIQRSGSNAVNAAGEAYIYALYGWFDEIGAITPEEKFTEMQSKEYELRRAVSNVLHDGPYFDDKKYMAENDREQ